MQAQPDLRFTVGACDAESVITRRTPLELRLLVGFSCWAVSGCVASSGGRVAPSTDTKVELTQSRSAVQNLTKGMERRAGLWPLYVDTKKGRVFVALPRGAEDGVLDKVLYVDGLTTGLGSNPIGLDRGQLGETRVLLVRRVGSKVIFEQPNLAFRVETENADERRALKQSFAHSVLWVTEVVATDAEHTLIDLTPFLLKDMHGVTKRLRDTGQGSFSLESKRSFVELDSALAFPNNLELEAVLTFTSDEPGPEVRSTTPDPNSVSLVLHHSFVRLPPPGYVPRRFDPRAGSFPFGYRDYSAHLAQPVESKWIVRHRLQKVNPSQAVSEAKTPIIYYLDRGVPEPVRSALLDGARWWTKAFEAAGFKNAFRVELLPENAHPLDIRYNVIQWVHRKTRGWSYGGGVVDPRTGEMLKGHVTLGSLRVRQDRLLFEGLLGVETTASGHTDDPIILALARIRQLAAHEVGHTLGLAHNFAASSYSEGRASVMDYPAPFVDVLPDGHIDTSKAYDVDVGPWDLHAIRYAYSEFPPDVDESAELDRIIQEGVDKGYRMVSDAAARPPGAALPRGSLWDNGTNPVTALRRVLKVRRIALDSFGANRVEEGQPLAHLEEVFATVYLYHRYQLAATVKAVGGLIYGSNIRGDDKGQIRAISGERQRGALQAVLRTLAPSVLDIPESALDVLFPRSFGDELNRELFYTRAAPAFDALGAAMSSARYTLELLFEANRAARLFDQHRRNPSLPGLGEVLSLAERRVFYTPAQPRRRRIQEAVQYAFVRVLMKIAASKETSFAVRSLYEQTLVRVASRLATEASADNQARAHSSALRRLIRRYLNEGWNETQLGAQPGDLPPGSPIGTSLEEPSSLNMIFRKASTSGCGFP